MVNDRNFNFKRYTVLYRYVYIYLYGNFKLLGYFIRIKDIENRFQIEINYLTKENDFLTFTSLFKI